MCIAIERPNSEEKTIDKNRLSKVVKEICSSRVFPGIANTGKKKVKENITNEKKSSVKKCFLDANTNFTALKVFFIF